MLKIIQRFEKGQKFLDLCESYSKELKRDCNEIRGKFFEVILWDNGPRLNDHTILEFESETMARMFIKMNDWKEQKELT